MSELKQDEDYDNHNANAIHHQRNNAKLKEAGLQVIELGILSKPSASCDTRATVAVGSTSSTMIKYLSLVDDIEPFPSPEPTQLQREPANRNGSNGIPGAYAVQGIRPVFHRPRPRSSTDAASSMTTTTRTIADQESNDGLELPSVHIVEESIHSNLIHAEPIDEETELEQLPTAEPFSTKARNIWKKKLFLSLSVELLVAQLVILAITIGFILLTKGSTATTTETGARKRQHNGAIQMPFFTSTEGAMINEAPTKNDLAELLLRRLNLPNYTLETLQDSQSAQARAYEWLIHDTGTSLAKYPNWRLKQRFVMATVFYSTKGEHWVNHHGWLDHDIHECNWEQSFLDQEDSPDRHCDETGHIHTLSRQYSKLAGTIPPEISLLSNDLQILNVFKNLDLTGSIPTQIGLLTQLTELSFALTALTGSLPTELGQLRRMDILSLGSPKITGAVPSELGLLRDVTDVSLLSLGASGILPPELYKKRQIKKIIVFDSPGIDLGAALPNLATLPESQLETFAWDSAEGQQPIQMPDQLGVLSNLRMLILYGVTLKGSIPASIGKLSSLVFLQLKENSLSGSLPSELSMLSDLDVLSLESNQLTGKLDPRMFRNLSNLKWLHVNNNSFTGTLPTEIGSMHDLTELWLEQTHLSGTLIPSELLSNLTSLTVANTSLLGSIPSQLCNSLSKYEMKCFGSIHGCYPEKVQTNLCEGTALCGCSCAPC